MQLKTMLVKAMDNQGVTQAKLAQLARVSKATLHGYLNPRVKQTRIDIAIVKRLCDILKLDFHVALFGLPDPNSQALIPKEILHEIFNGDVRVTIHRIEKK